MYNILKLNEISALANPEFSAEYNLSSKCENPDAIMLRSFNMLDYDIPKSVTCIARAGAGVNNIPVSACTEKGIVVFNTPGANANAVKELTLCGLFLASRSVYDGIAWSQSLKGTENITKTVESGKKNFVGPEILGKKLGVIGLGAIGILVANSAIKLGMDVVGYDPFISVDSAWKLDRHVVKETNLDNLLAKCDYVTIHVPLMDSTRNTLNKDNLAKAKDGIAVLNFARGELIDNDAIIEAVNSGKVSRYITDFPCEKLLGIKNIVTLPHLGASTPEAEDNCAIMAAKQAVDFIENGNIVNSVNMPNCSMPRQGTSRITIIHKNVVNVLNPITAIISSKGHNIENFISKARGDYAYTIIDIDNKIDEATIKEITSIENVVKVRVL